MITACWIEKRFYDKLQDDNAQEISRLKALTAYNRINALSTIYQAKHGWIGAAFSAAEIVTALYFRLLRPGDQLLLSKGHAAVIQYAALAGRGTIPVNSLARYKEHNGPQAHTDISTPGIAVNTGSLGQTLSKAFGMSIGRQERYYVILGDGELQEGQNFEAFMTLAHYRQKNVIPIVDRNFLQSDSNITDIKKIHDLEGVLQGFGFNVIHITDGNDMGQVVAALETARDSATPSAVIADTRKGAGVSFMSADRTPRRHYKWHGGIPSRQEYAAALSEIAEGIDDAEIRKCIDDYVINAAAQLQVASPVITKLPIRSTGEAFGNTLMELAPQHPEMAVLDADLEKSCRLTAFANAFPDQFIEMGIAEQDMVSTAGGLALTGRLPVVNTYGSFMRRAFEQIYVNATEHTKVIYAGHYCGLCYTTDGKTHQCTGDVAMMRSIPGMHVVYPTFAEELPGILNWYIDEVKSGPLYIRLHRTAPLLRKGMPDDLSFRGGFGNLIRFYGKEHCILTSGPQMAVFCADACDNMMENTRNAPDIFTVSTLRNLAPEFLSMLGDRYKKIYVIEELIAAGGLFDEVAHGYAVAGGKTPELIHYAPDGLTFSTRDPLGLYRHFGLTPPQIEAFLTKSLPSLPPLG